MVKQNGGGSSGEDDAHKYKFVDDAKDLLDQIGETIEQQARKAALPYNNDLHGHLSKAKFSNGDKVRTDDPCDLNYNYDTYVTSTVINPCEHKSGKRLSEVHNSECDRKKIKDSENNTAGACAPFRRLHVCDKNLEQIKPHTITATHNLLVDVCMAAKFEGQSIRGYHPQYDEQYPSFGSTMCTMLARSFADIGDIIRGKDLFIGNNKRDKLEKQLQKYFNNIYDNLVGAAKNHYKDDAKGGHFYQLREDWWNINRKKVWDAITCDAKGFNYFRHTCGTGPERNLTNNDCRCIDQTVPTYFDYVPQYLRWFEEWAEDFCRKRKKKIENAIKNCRKPNGKDKYCDLNGYNCEETAKKENKLFPDSECHKCSVACNPFVPWIDNQQKEFLKQKNKYDKEINKNHKTTIKIGNATINNFYVKEFYEKLNKGYGKVETFLEKLSKEKICEKQPEVGNQKADSANFTKDNLEETFSHTEYCRACPLCGAHKIGGKWKAKTEPCEKGRKKTYHQEDTTTIEILTADNEKFGIYEKYKSFCDSVKNTANGATPTANGGGQIKKWQCHYEGLNNNNCIQGEWEKFTGEEDVRSYHSFFYGSIIDMLIDSIEWKKNLKTCINNDKSKKCVKKCNSKCKCYKNWITQKKKELDGIKDHFRKQKDIKNTAEREMTLNITLNNYFLKDIKEAYAKPEQVTKIEELLGKKFNEELDFLNEKRIIEEFLVEEQQKADKCLDTHTKDDCPPQERDGVARSDTGTPSRVPTDGRSPQPPDPATGSAGGHGAEDEDEEEENEDDEDDKDAVVQVDVEEEKTATQQEPTVENICAIVKTALTSGEPKNTFKEVCEQKYGQNAPSSWKCIPTKTNDVATSDEGSPSRSRRDTSDVKTTPPSNSGSICVPPRRRKLYVGHLQKWANSSGNTQAGGGEAPLDSTQASTSSPSNPRDVDLRNAFIQSAAIETFFLWDRYKKQKEKPQGVGVGAPGALPGVQAQPLQPIDNDTPPTDDDKDPHTLLQSGTIPPSFLRQMFYTLGDYRDICVDNVPNGIDTVSASDQKDKGANSKLSTQEISEKIKNVIENSGSKPSGQTPQEWWEKNGEHIWHGMICALTYKDSEGKEQPPKEDQSLKDQLLENGNPITKYQYKTVELKEDNTSSAMSTGPKPIIASSSSDENTPTTLNTPKLTQFVLRPTYFRYLEEWGQNFCKKRTEMLGKIKEECRSGTGGHEYCGGDGHDCIEKNLKHHKMLEDPDCPGCYEQCRKYRKWIDIKFQEYHNQQSIYQKEHEKLQRNSSKNGGDDDNTKFCQQIKEKTSAAKFLEALRHCKNAEGDKEKGTEEEKNNKIDFKNPENTFNPSTYCKTCPPNKVNCNGSGRGKNGCKEVNGNEWETVFNANGGKSSTIEVEMIDRRGPYMKEYMNEKSQKSKESNNSLFKDSYLFKSVREQNWTCKYKGENMDLCKLNNFEENIDLNQYTTFKVFLIYWLQDFIESYYILKKKKLIEKCTPKEGETCSEGNSKNGCVCVKKWVEKKEIEWKEIKKHFNNRNQTKGDDDMKSSVKQLLDPLIPRMNLVNDKGKITKLSVFDKSCGCSADASSTNGNEDAIDCMLNKLTEKIKTESCSTATSGQTCTQSTSQQTLDLDDQIDEDPENKVAYPKICGDMGPTQPKTVEKDTCEEAPTPPPAPAPTAESEKNPGQVPESPEEKAPAPAPDPPKPQRPRRPRRTLELLDNPPLKTALMSSTIMWSIGIGFATFTYFFLKVLYIYIYIDVYAFCVYVFVGKKEKGNIKTNLLNKNKKKKKEKNILKVIKIKIKI